jgi:sodium-dependent dicarboxylate transporter 2/3/5
MSFSGTDQGPDEAFPRHRRIGLVAGPLVCGLILLFPPPGDLSREGWWIAGVGLWMAIWWMTEALPLAVTAFLPLLTFPTLNLRDIKETTPSYAHPLIFLFLGGFLLARAMRVWELDKRLALTVLNLVGTSPQRLIAGFMGVTAFLSMWVSNTATSMVMLPIALSVVATLPEEERQVGSPVPTALLLGIAYAATIGGMGTIIGTPPNALFVGYMMDNHNIEISFLRWMMVGIPLVLVLLPAVACQACRRGGESLTGSSRERPVD